MKPRRWSRKLPRQLPVAAAGALDWMVSASGISRGPASGEQCSAPPGVMCQGSLPGHRPQLSWVLMVLRWRPHECGDSSCSVAHPSPGQGTEPPARWLSGEQGSSAQFARTGLWSRWPARRSPFWNTGSLLPAPAPSALRCPLTGAHWLTYLGGHSREQVQTCACGL